MTYLKKIIYPLMLASALVACSEAANTPAAGITPTPPSQGSSSPTGIESAPTFKEQIQALEDSDKLPKLDRSSSIAGPDANKNGIRDDIDAWIAALPITDVQKKAAEQAARVRQAELLVSLTDKAEQDRLGDLSARSVNCLGDIFMPDYQKGLDLSRSIKAITANTKERAMQYLAYNRAVSGSSGRFPDGDTCDP